MHLTSTIKFQLYNGTLLNRMSGAISNDHFSGGHTDIALNFHSNMAKKTISTLSSFNERLRDLCFERFGHFDSGAMNLRGSKNEEVFERFGYFDSGAMIL